MTVSNLFFEQNAKNFFCVCVQVLIRLGAFDIPLFFLSAASIHKIAKGVSVQCPWLLFLSSFYPATGIGIVTLSLFI